jgi:hypothetical protein
MPDDALSEPMRLVLYGEHDQVMTEMDISETGDGSSAVLEKGRPRRYELFAGSGERIHGGPASDLLFNPEMIEPTRSWPIIGLIDVPVSIGVSRLQVFHRP